jgi:hypothetical protein
MVSATKIASVVPSQLVDAVTDRLPDHLPEIPDLPLHMSDVTTRFRPKKKRFPWGRVTLPLAVVGLGAGVFFLLRGRRASTRVGADAPADTYATT